jgi:hypothetical protein
VTAPRIACIVDLRGWAAGDPSPVAKSFSAAPKRPVQFTVEQAKDPSVLAKQLNSIQQELTETTHQTRSQPIQAPIIFANLSMTSGDTVTLTHNFGRAAFWTIVGWHGSGVTAAPGFVDDRDDTTPITDTNVLHLRASVTGVVDLMVF